MNLEEQFLAMGMSADDAKKNADGFVTGLKELGLSDDNTTDTTQVAYKSTGLENALLKVGVRPTLIKKYSKALDKAMFEFSIESKNQRAMFSAQLLHESAMLTATIENLNYSELGLVKVFKKYFDRNNAKKYARQPERIANRVYADRMGNGNEDSGDGWKFRGRGLIQLTGKETYIACGKGLGIDLIKNPDYLLTPEGSTRSAGWFWKSKKLGTSADRGDIIANTKIINGGMNGLEHRSKLYESIKLYL